MKKIIFLANCNSPHLDRWVNLLAMLNIEVNIWSIHSCKNKKNKMDILPKYAKALPVLLQYVLAGLLLRFRDSQYVFHAHNTSGYGLTAYLSGKKYIVTTYGSEIFNTNKKGVLYKTLIKKILDRSRLITSTSQEMKSQLENNFLISPNKIKNFSLGVDTDVFFPMTRMHSINKTWIINRRMHPHYNTLETIEGFINYINSGRMGRLIVVLGDYDEDYYKKIEGLLDLEKHKNNINIIDKFLDRKDLCSLLQIADFSISTPKTDQLSSSLLESMACGTIPILFNLQSYQSIIESKSCIIMNNRKTKDFERIFIKTSEMKTEQINEISHLGIQFIETHESSKVVLPKIKDLYKNIQ